MLPNVSDIGVGVCGRLIILVIVLMMMVMVMMNARPICC